MAILDLDDIQGIIVRGYSPLSVAYFVLLQIQDADPAKVWLDTLGDEVRNGESRPHEPVVNVAFTRSGLVRLGLEERVLAQFANEFVEGMTAEHRKRILGDHGDSAPENWDWGGPNNEEVHVLLMLYATDETQLNDYYTSHHQRFNSQGLIEVHRLDSLTLNGRKEHFGFRDGIAQPNLEGPNKDGPSSNQIKPGEVILGYANEYGQYPESPLIDPSQDPGEILATAADRPPLRDLGRNGSYLVFRQIHQRVKNFWKSLDDATKNPDGSTNAEEMVRLAAKMVGRWPSGAPLINSPGRDQPGHEDDDAFMYHDADPYGHRCPIGSHIRRTNPRDMLDPKPGSKKSIAVGNRHRILRRGRAYGRPVAESMDPVEILNGADDMINRGLHFLCFNANIGRQFEFIQQNWAYRKEFAGLYNEADPIIGDHDPRDEGQTGIFTVQAPPVRKRITGLTRFVDIKGSAYFFMPGIKAIHYLASLP